MIRILARLSTSMKKLILQLAWYLAMVFCKADKNRNWKCAERRASTYKFCGELYDFLTLKESKLYFFKYGQIFREGKFPVTPALRQKVVVNKGTVLSMFYEPVLILGTTPGHLVWTQFNFSLENKH